MRALSLLWFVAAAVVGIAGPAIAKSSPIAPIVKAEIAFDAYTHKHGYTKGFFTFSAPDAIAFQPEAVRIHEKLAAALAADSSEKDAPSALRWQPRMIGVSGSGDLAFDLGTWRKGDNAGWFLTLWKKQADGRWLWTLDTGAGVAAPKDIPSPGVFMSYATPWVEHPDTHAFSTISGRDEQINQALAVTDATSIFRQDPTAGLLDNTAIVLTGDLPPAESEGDIASALAKRPHNAIWTMDGGEASAGNDLVYTYGHVAAKDGTYLGHYVRVWRQSEVNESRWTLFVDLYVAASQ